MALDSYLEKKDYLVIGGGILLSLIIAFISPRLFQNPVGFEAYSRLVVGAVILWGVCLQFIWLSSLGLESLHVTSS
ncbi:MAG: hypothetical protein ABEJ95_06555 [Candidatus Nanohalobium sp.]